jgi:hypothetical protein
MAKNPMVENPHAIGVSDRSLGKTDTKMQKLFDGPQAAA